MKQNSEFGLPPSFIPGIPPLLEGLAVGLLRCDEHFKQEIGPHPDDRCCTLAFGNAVYITIKNPEAAAELLSEFLSAGYPGDREAVVSAFRSFVCHDDWVARLGEILAALQPRAHDEASGVASVVNRVLFSAASGLVVAQQLPEIARLIEKASSDLNSESRFLAGRLHAWSETNWQPAVPPFIEYVSGFYEPKSKEREVLTQAMEEVLRVALSFSDPWKLGVWADSGWYAGRRIVATMPDVVRDLVAEVPAAELAAYADLYRQCVLSTAANDGTVRPERAALRYFGITARDIYARALCCGDQRRFVARAAYDLTFWMAICSQVVRVGEQR